MSESNTRRITRLGQRVADEVLADNPPADRVYSRLDLLASAGLKPEPGSRQELTFFQALNERLKDKAGRMYLVAGPGKVTICQKEDTVRFSEAIAVRDADARLGRHLATCALVERHLSPEGRVESAASIKRVSGLSETLRKSVAETALDWARAQLAGGEQ